MQPLKQVDQWIQERPHGPCFNLRSLHLPFYFRYKLMSNSTWEVKCDFAEQRTPQIPASTINVMMAQKATMNEVSVCCISSDISVCALCSREDVTHDFFVYNNKGSIFCTTNVVTCTTMLNVTC